ncbi:MAG: hypothetical protein AAB584_01310 [Patescibacteria group bacterium]
MKFLLGDSYFKAIENSIGSKLFRNLYLDKSGKKIDASNNGQFSCAVFVSWILRIFYLIEEGHATVDGTMKDVEKSGWYKIQELKPGAVLVWEEIFLNGSLNKHIGFYIGRNKAVSNSRTLKIPVKHHWTFGSKNDKNYRRVIEIWWHKKLD